MLYISVSMIFGAPHQHSTDAAADHCASCAWQAGSVVDVPLTATFIQPPAPRFFVQSFVTISVFFYVPADAQSRGPPVSCS
ncbi:MAG: hypothetical protein JWM99_2298 [Verrucomicrobiales bacterium]|jgi:hypothetical protein|nr:hypothetical protein [Verrucomicrobiales bacterium]